MSYPELKMLIAGEWVLGSTGKSEPVICPADGSEMRWGLQGKERGDGGKIEISTATRTEPRTVSASSQALLRGPRL